MAYWFKRRGLKYNFKVAAIFDFQPEQFWLFSIYQKKKKKKKKIREKSRECHPS